MSASANVTSGRVFGPDGPRVAIAGFFIECNRFAPVSTAAEFRRGGLDLAGDALARELAADSPRVLPDTVGFLSTMRSAGPWTPVPLRMAAAQPGGPVEHDYFTSLRDEIVARLRAVAPVDGVFISAHGAALTTGCEDPDGELFEAMREAVGPDVPIVAVFDLHANVSERMTRALSAFIAYRTNPHVDLHERGVDATRALMRLWREGPGVVERVGLPFVPPAPTQLIAPGTPCRELIDLADPTVAGDIENVSLCGGFALADSPKCGFSVVVSAVRGQRHAARERALALAREVWDRRERFALRLVSLDDAVRRACEAGRSGDGPRGILADVADNPGGGAGGNTIALLRALLDARVRGVLLGVFTDAELAAEAHQLGLGARFQAVFNRLRDADPITPRFACPARVSALADGGFVGRKGMLRGSRREMGPSALLDLDGVEVAVISLRQQLLDPAQRDALGVDLSKVRTLVVKSRGHFRAAFDDFTDDRHILEVDCPGADQPLPGSSALDQDAPSGVPDRSGYPLALSGRRSDQAPTPRRTTRLSGVHRTAYLEASDGPVTLCPSPVHPRPHAPALPAELHQGAGRTERVDQTR